MNKYGFKIATWFNDFVIYLSWMDGMIKETFLFTAENYNIMGKFKDLVKSSELVLVDFYADWCGPCKMIGPIVEELAGEYEGKAIIGKVNVDENPSLSAKFMIRNIPTLLVLKDGQIVEKQVGGVPKGVLAGKLDAHV